MNLFKSNRERNLWLWILLVMIAIYSTLGLAGTLAGMLREQNLVGALFFFFFLMIVAAIIGSGLQRRVGRREIWVTVGVIAVYGMLLARLGLSPEERTHLFEYGVVAILIHQALTERRNHGGRVSQPAIFAVLLTALLGWIDEGIQAVLPNRVYDIRAVGVNVIAGLMAVLARLALMWARKRISNAPPDEQKD